MSKYRLLYVANKQLPENDYRVIYGKQSAVSEVAYALPNGTRSSERWHIPVNIGEGVSLSDIGGFASLFRLFLKRPRYDGVHFFSTKLILLGPLLARIAGLPSIVTVTGLGRTFDGDSAKHKVLQALYWSMMRVTVALSRRVLFQNHGHLELFRKRFPKYAAKMQYIGSAVDVDVRRRPCAPKRALHVLMVARLMPTKGVGDYLAIAEQLADSGIKFVLVGPASSGHPETLRRVLDANSSGLIEYLGELHGESLKRQYSAADVFLFPSSYGEGLPRVLLEAGFLGLCPIAYDIVANRDLVQPGRGFLIRPGDINEVVEVLRNLANDRSLLHENAISYQQHIIHNYSPDVYCRRMDRVVVEVMTEVRRAR